MQVEVFKGIVPMSEDWFSSLGMRGSICQVEQTRALLRSNLLRNRLVSDAPKVFRGEADTHACVGLDSFSRASVPRNLRTSELSLKNLGGTSPATKFPEEPTLLTAQGKAWIKNRFAFHHLPPRPPLGSFFGSHPSPPSRLPFRAD